MNLHGTDSPRVEQAEAPAVSLSGLLTGEQLSAFQACSRQLRSPTPRTRSEAAERLGDFGPAALERLTLALRDLEAEVQVAAVGSLAKIGGAEVEALLLEGLRSEHRATRMAAAEALTEVGGAEILSPLIASYHRCFPTRSARRDRWAWLLLSVGFVVAIVALLVLVLQSEFIRAGRLFWLITYWGLLLAAFRQRSAPRKMLDALLKAAERSPSTELLNLLPELRAVAGDRFLYRRPDREAYRTAVERIESLTAAFNDLPVPATAPGLDGRDLPLAANHQTPPCPGRVGEP